MNIDVSLYIGLHYTLALPIIEPNVCAVLFPLPRLIAICLPY
jgi:hypothetical protein